MERSTVPAEVRAEVGGDQASRAAVVVARILPQRRRPEA